MSPPGNAATQSERRNTSAATPRCTTTTVTPKTRAEYVARLVAAAPPISVETRERLATLLRPAGSGGRAA